MTEHRVTGEMVEALRESLWATWGEGRQTTDWPSRLQLRWALHHALDASPQRGSVEALESLRAAWNAHMASCPQYATMRAPTFEEIEAWRNAPSDTASGGQ